MYKTLSIVIDRQFPGKGDKVLRIVGLWGQNALVQVMIAPLAVTLGRLLSFTMPQFL